MSPSSSFDLHAHVTNLIVSAIEQGEGVTSLPWRRTGLPNCLPAMRTARLAINGINILALWASAMLRGYPFALWCTYRQWTELGAQVRKGEKASTVTFYKEYAIDADPANAQALAWSISIHHRPLSTGGWPFCDASLWV
jgi:antirestriction protein ArdC